LNKIKFIADVHISPLTIERLEKNGYDIQRITEFLSPRAGDEEIINLSIEKNAVIITQDLDFSNLIVQHGLTKPSVISIRIEKPIPKKVAKILLELLPKIEEELLKGCIVSVDDNQFRIRQLPVRIL
jgi:predicted nuclease of predicted toxin-antitoxin system